jgi:ribonuclease HI
VKAFGVQDLAEFAARVAELRATLAPPTEVDEYVAYTDGACFGNPEGRGGWAAAVFKGLQQWLLYGHLSSTSNNRAEALGVLGALEWVPPGSTLRLHSDSELTVRQLQGRYKVKANTDIWDLLRTTRSDKHVELIPEWVRGHAGDPLNELADRLSKAGAMDTVFDAEVPIPTKPAGPAELVGLVPNGGWERDFLNSIREQLQRGRALSPKQQAVLDRMRSRPAQS